MYEDKELQEIQEAILHPENVVVNGSDTWTVAHVKAFIIKSRTPMAGESSSPSATSHEDASPLERAKLMLDAKAVIEHYDRIIETIDEHRLVLDQREADFVMTVEDYQVLRDFASRDDAPTQAINLEGVAGDEMDKSADRAALLTRLMAAGTTRSETAQKPVAWRWRIVSTDEIPWLYATEKPNNLNDELFWDVEPLFAASAPSAIAPSRSALNAALKVLAHSDSGIYSQEVAKELLRLAGVKLV